MNLQFLHTGKRSKVVQSLQKQRWLYCSHFIEWLSVGYHFLPNEDRGELMNKLTRAQKLQSFENLAVLF